MKDSRPLVGIDASRSTVRPRTGTESYSWHLIRQLVERDARHRFRLYFNGAPDSDDLAYLSARADVRQIPFARLWTHARLSAEMLARPPDLLFVPSHVLPALRPRRTVVTVHDLGYLYWPDAHQPRRRIYLDLSTRFNAAVATLIIADSTATMRDLVLHYGTSPERLRVVHLGCDPRYRPQPRERVAAVRERYALPDRYILAVGTIHPRKNLVRLVDAFAAIRRGSLEDVGLVIVGRDGWGAAEVHDRARPLGEAVRFLDYVVADDMPALYTGAAAFAFPSLHEGFGLPAVEAMACGAPVVAADASSLPEVVGDAGILVRPTDPAAIAEALSAVLTDSALSTCLRAAGLARAGRFTWERCADEVAAVFGEALER